MWGGLYNTYSTGLEAFVVDNRVHSIELIALVDDYGLMLPRLET